MVEYVKYPFCYLAQNLFSPGILCGYTYNVPGISPENELPGLFKNLGFHPSLAYLKQIHSEWILEAPLENYSPGDGLISDQRNLVLIIKTADCMPLLIHNEKEDWISALHMGWRSALKGILDNLPRDLSSCRVLLNPGLRQCCFEVGSEFLSHTPFSYFIRERGHRYFFDPVAFTFHNLSQKGLSPQNFFDCGICTYCHPQRLYSFRRNKDTQRTFHFILKK